MKRASAAFIAGSLLLSFSDSAPQAQCTDKWYGGCPSEACIADYDRIVRLPSAERVKALQQWRAACGSTESLPPPPPLPSPPSPPPPPLPPPQAAGPSNWNWGTPVEVKRRFCVTAREGIWSTYRCGAATCPASPDSSDGCRLEYSVREADLHDGGGIETYRFIGVQESLRVAAQPLDEYRFDFFSYENWMDRTREAGRVGMLVFSEGGGVRSVVPSATTATITQPSIDPRMLRFPHELEARPPANGPSADDRSALAFRTLVVQDPALTLVSAGDVPFRCAAMIPPARKADILCVALNGSPNLVAPLALDAVSPGDNERLAAAIRSRAVSGDVLTPAIRAVLSRVRFSKGCWSGGGILRVSPESGRSVVFVNCELLVLDRGTEVRAHASTAAVVKGLLEQSSASTPHRALLSRLLDLLVAQPSLVVLAAEPGQGLCHGGEDGAQVRCVGEAQTQWNPIPRTPWLADVWESLAHVTSSGGSIARRLPLLNRFLRRTLTDHSRLVLAFGSIKQKGAMLGISREADLAWDAGCTTRLELVSDRDESHSTVAITATGESGLSCDARLEAGLAHWSALAVHFASSAPTAIGAVYFGPHRAAARYQVAGREYLAVAPTGTRSIPAVAAAAVEACRPFPMSGDDVLPPLSELLHGLVVPDWRSTKWRADPMGLLVRAAGNGCEVKR